MILPRDLFTFWSAILMPIIRTVLVRIICLRRSWLPLPDSGTHICSGDGGAMLQLVGNGRQALSSFPTSKSAQSVFFSQHIIWILHDLLPQLSGCCFLFCLLIGLSVKPLTYWLHDGPRRAKWNRSLLRSSGMGSWINACCRKSAPAQTNAWELSSFFASTLSFSVNLRCWWNKKNYWNHLLRTILGGQNLKSLKHAFCHLNRYMWWG